MTTKKNEVKIQYPFRSKASIVAQIATDDTFALNCLDILQARTASRKVGDKAMGWMSSHAKKAAGLVESREVAGVRELVSSYSKQLAAHFRQEAIASDPDLADVAALFSAN